MGIPGRLRLALLCALLASGSVAQASSPDAAALAEQSNCGGCEIAFLGNGHRIDNINNGQLNVCFASGGFTSQEIAGLKEGLKYWEDYFATNSSFPAISFTYTGGTCHLSFIATSLPDPGVIAQANGTASGGNVNIVINNNRLGNNRPHNFWAWVGAHELEHLQGIAHSTGNCDRTKTIMTATFPENLNEPLGTAVRCTDAAAMATMYLHVEEYTGGYGDDSQEVYEESSGYWECTVDWWVTDYYYWNGSYYEYWFSTWEQVAVYDCMYYMYD